MGEAELLAAYIIHFLACVYSTIALVRDRVTGTLARMFICGYRRREIIFGYVAGYSTIAIGQSAIVLALTELLFDVNLRPDILPVVVTIVALAVVSVGLGVFISNFARNEGQIFPFIPLVTIPSALLSGGAGRSGSMGRPQFIGGDEGIDHGRIELAAPGQLQLPERLLRRHCLAVGPVGHHCLEGVGH